MSEGMLGSIPPDRPADYRPTDSDRTHTVAQARRSVNKKAALGTAQWILTLTAATTRPFLDAESYFRPLLYSNKKGAT
jgi:hypothetical protein